MFRDSYTLELEMFVCFIMDPVVVSPVFNKKRYIFDSFFDNPNSSNFFCIDKKGFFCLNIFLLFGRN